MGMGALTLLPKQNPRPSLRERRKLLGPQKNLGSQKDPPASDAKKDIKKGGTPASSSQKHEKTAYAVEKGAFMEKSLGSIGHVSPCFGSIIF